MDHPAPAIISLAPSSAKATTKSAPLLEAHLGAIVGAAAGALAEAVGEFSNGGLTGSTRGRGSNLIYELFRLREYMLSDYPEFDSLARQRGVEALQAGGAPVGAASILVDGVLEILNRIVRDELEYESNHV